MLHSIASLLNIAASKARSVEKTLEAGRKNIERAPKECREMLVAQRMEGCFLLPFMGSKLERRSGLSKFILGFSKRHQCWFGYGGNGVLLFVEADNYLFVHPASIDRVRSNWKNGSEILLWMHTPATDKIRLKFGEDSSALKFCGYLQTLWRR
ncbi:hypothetical protein [Luteolibacter soli]|uniref:YokE-like PH domain-containing protein n=1 Tax=Luteolibacter soli TaxID=3135280 RepID=A0ABU9B1W0_9BACT